MRFYWSCLHCRLAGGGVSLAPEPGKRRPLMRALVITPDSKKQMKIACFAFVNDRAARLVSAFPSSKNGH